MAATDRLVAFDACFNFRDLGGYPAGGGDVVRRGVVYRSDALHRMSDGDIDAFGALGLRTVVDLRSQTELDDYGTLHRRGRAGLEWHHVPLQDVAIRLAAPTEGELAEIARVAATPPGEHYMQMLGRGDGVARALAILLTPGRLPGVFHCTGGRDRTGIIAALLLDLLGVADDAIVADYVLTAETRERSTRWIVANEPGFAAFLAHFPPQAPEAMAPVMLGFLARFREAFGSTERFVLERGVPEEHVTTFRGALLARADHDARASG